MKTGVKVLSILLGIVMIICGTYCLISPGLTFLAIGWIVGFCMIVDAVGNIATWNARKKLGIADGWTLFATILSLCFGIIVIASNAVQFAVNIFIAYMAAAWVLWIGILRLALSAKMHHIRKELGNESIAKHWWLVMINGILLILIGILGLMNLAVAAIAIGTLIGIDILFAGANMIVAACIA